MVGRSPSISMESYPDFRSAAVVAAAVAAVAGVFCSYFWDSDCWHRPSYQVSQNLQGCSTVSSA